jgi:hypothetical protein
MGGKRAAVLAARAVAGAALVTVLAGCGAPQLMGLAAACAADSDGKDVAVEGYISTGGAVSCNNYDGDYRCMIDITEHQDATGADAGIDVLVGDGSNQMDELPESFGDADLHVRADNGAAVASGDRVRTSGEVSVAPGDICWVTVDKIEKI